jgi:hypothetical protein
VCQQTAGFVEGEGDEPVFGLSSFPAVVAVTARNAWASMARVMCRYQAL